MCEQTLSTLGLKSKVDRFFNNIGFLHFMQRDVPTNERITLEFLSTLTFKLEKTWVEGVIYYYGTLKFWLFNQDIMLSVEDLGEILRLPVFGPGENHLK